MPADLMSCPQRWLSACTNSPTFAGAIDAALGQHDALCTGEVRYLPPGDASGADFATLLARSCWTGGS